MKLLKIDIHVRYTMMHVRNVLDILKITTGNCKFVQLTILCCVVSPYIV